MPICIERSTFFKSFRMIVYFDEKATYTAQFYSDPYVCRYLWKRSISYEVFKIQTIFTSETPCLFISNIIWSPTYSLDRQLGFSLIKIRPGPPTFTPPRNRPPSSNTCCLCQIFKISALFRPILLKLPPLFRRPIPV